MKMEKVKRKTVKSFLEFLCLYLDARQCKKAHKSGVLFNFEKREKIIFKTYATTKKRVKFQRRKHLCRDRCRFEELDSDSNDRKVGT
jgi:hypothetical protein